MEILKDTPEQECVAKCNRCQTVLKFKESEAKFVDDYREPYVEVTCPVCGNRVTKNL